MSDKLTIQIDADKSAHAISPMLYGIFYEDVNHAADGGLYAELIRNRFFEDAVAPDGCTVSGGTMRSPTGWETRFPDDDLLPIWTLAVSGSAKARMTAEVGDTIHPARIPKRRHESEPAYIVITGGVE